VKTLLYIILDTEEKEQKYSYNKKINGINSLGKPIKYALIKVLNGNSVIAINDFLNTRISDFNKKESYESKIFLNLNIDYKNTVQ
jgi:hypothetical protein